MAMNEELTAKLRQAGFRQDDRVRKAIEDSAAKDGMSESGQYLVDGVWTKGIVTLTFEQNTSPSPAGEGLIATITHPSVCVISSAKGRVAVNPQDTQLLLTVADELS